MHPVALHALSLVSSSQYWQPADHMSIGYEYLFDPNSSSGHLYLFQHVIYITRYVHMRGITNESQHMPPAHTHLRQDQ